MLSTVLFYSVGGFFVGDRLDPLLKRNDLIVAGHDGHGSKLEPFREVHRCDRSAAVPRLQLLIKDDVRYARGINRRARPWEL